MLSPLQWETAQRRAATVREDSTLQAPLDRHEGTEFFWFQASEARFSDAASGDMRIKAARDASSVAQASLTQHVNRDATRGATSDAMRDVNNAAFKFCTETQRGAGERVYGTKEVGSDGRICWQSGLIRV